MNTQHQHDLSIVIISFNTIEITRDCLRSVFENLCGLNTQVIVVDNDSKDGSADMVAAEFPQVELIRNTDNRGFAAANNQGFERCTGEFVLLLNSDTVVLGDVLGKSVEYMREHPDVGVFGCRVLNPDRTMQPTCFMVPSLLNLTLMTLGLSRFRRPRFFGRMKMLDWHRDSEREVQVVTGCYMLVRRKAMDEVGWLDDSFFFCGEETDWCVRFRQADWKIIFSPVGEIIHIGNASGRRFEARRDLMLTEGIVRFHRKHHGLVGAAAAYAVLWVFNSTHALLWAILAVVRPGDRAKQRCRHFVEVTKGFGSAWPKRIPRVAAQA
ncbi:MAG: glycosyltransferase family 2 protein [Phycisphaerales bacterium JB065]